MERGPCDLLPGGGLDLRSRDVGGQADQRDVVAESSGLLDLERQHEAKDLLVERRPGRQRGLHAHLDVRAVTGAQGLYHSASHRQEPHGPSE